MWNVIQKVISFSLLLTGYTFDDKYTFHYSFFKIKISFLLQFDVMKTGFIYLSGGLEWNNIEDTT
jgi:hypothetical protein